MSLVFSAKDVSLSFHKFRPKGARIDAQNLFEGLTFDVYSGESLAVVGRNGAGKSTLMRLMAGIIQEDSGEVINRSQSPSLLSLSAGFIPVLSGRENIYLSATLLGLSTSEIKRHYRDIVEYADLEKHINKPISTYSSGMRARLGFSIAKFSRADLLLIDEILGVGDDEFREKSSEAIRDMMKSDKTVVFVSHNDIAIESLCDRAIWLEYGRVVDDGSPEEVVINYHRYNRICKSIATKYGVTPSTVRENHRDRNPLEIIAGVHASLSEETEET